MLRGRLEAHGRDLRVRLKQARELRRRADNRRVPDAAIPPGVDDEDRGCDSPRAYRVAQHVVAADRFEVTGNPLVGARPELEREHRQREQDEKRRGGPGNELRVAHDEAREHRPEPALVVGTVLDPARRQKPHAVERTAGQREQRGKERDRSRDGDSRDEQAAEAEPADERKRHEEEQRQADRNGPTAEDHRASRRQHRRDDRLVARRPSPQLLAEAVDDEERVVDRDPEPDERDEVRQVRRQLHEVREDPDEPERGRDGQDCEREREQEGERPEREDEYQERDRDRDHLTAQEVLREHRVEVVLDRSLAGENDLRSCDRAGGAPHRLGSRLRVRGCEVGHDLPGDDVGGERCDGYHPARRELGGRALRGRTHPGDERGRVPVTADDEGERARRALPEMLLEDRFRPARVRARKREAVREERGELRRREAADEEDSEPAGEDEHTMAEDETCQRLH